MVRMISTSELHRVATLCVELCLSLCPGMLEISTQGTWTITDRCGMGIDLLRKYLGAKILNIVFHHLVRDELF